MGRPSTLGGRPAEELIAASQDRLKADLWQRIEDSIVQTALAFAAEHPDAPRAITAE